MNRKRMDVLGLAAGWSDTLVWYAKAVRALQSRPLTDPTSWWFLAAIHGFHPELWKEFGVIDMDTPLPKSTVQRRFWDQCQHQSWYFLPWHRGYVAAFEDIVREAILKEGGPENWALPYWNYSSSTQPNARTMPDVFDLATLPDGSENPLRVERRFGIGTKPIQLMPELVSLSALEDDEFTAGPNEIPPGFGGPETPFHHGARNATNGSLESMPHNVIHGAIGGISPDRDPKQPPVPSDLGLMSMTVTAALDPIFWLHHSNIDRLWSVWLHDAQHVNPDQLTWLDGPADRNFVMPASKGEEWEFTAREILAKASPLLEYTYEDEAPPVTVERRAARRLSRLETRVTANGDAQESERAVVNTERTPELIGASDGAVSVVGTTDAAIQLDPPATRSLRRSLRAASSNAQAETEPARVFLKLEGIRSASDAAIYYVYIDLPPDVDPAEHAERLAGVVSLFGVSALSDPDGRTAGGGVSQVLEITEIVDALHLEGDELEQLSVRFVPATPAVETAQFSIGRMGVYKL